MSKRSVWICSRNDAIGNLAVLCTPNAANVARLREFAAVWASDLATGTRTAGYYCASGTCGARVSEIIAKRQAVVIPG